MKKGIMNYNSKGEHHGYFERYSSCDLWYKCFYNNGDEIDYEEDYKWGGGLQKIFHI